MSDFEFLGPYRIGKSLGQGGMGAVLRGVHEKSGDVVAVKLIAQHVSDEERFRRRFHGEVETLKRLRHEGIVRLIGYGEEEGRLFYSMELVEGESLQQRIRREKKIGWKTTIDLMIDVCAALKHAHDIGIIHRDLKPANIVLTQRGKPKLVDFGIAKIFGYGEQTLAGSVLGTADFMAPEQANASGITTRTDLYSLGSVMYAMLVGRPPFKGKNITEVIESLRRQRPVPLDMIDPDIPNSLVQLVHDLLEKDPADRPPTALAVMNRLKAMRAGLQKELTAHDSHSTDADDPVTPVTRLRRGGNANDTDKSAGAHRTKPGTVVSVGDARPPMHSPTDATVVSGDVDKTIRPDEDEPPITEVEERKSHFQTVDDTVGTSGVFDSADESPTSVGQLLSIIGMIAILIGGSYLFYRSMQEPSADLLFSRIESTFDENRSAEAQQTIDKFRKLYPMDSRTDQVVQIAHELAVDRVVKRLRFNSKGITALEPSEQTLLDALERRETDPAGASEQLTRWISVYGRDHLYLEGSEFGLTLSQIASDEIRKLKQLGGTIELDAGLRMTLDQIMDSNDQPSMKAARLRNFISLHGENDLAVSSAEQLIDRLTLAESSAAHAVDSASTKDK